ncbi:hypothetical protein [Phaeovulum vinaykumarii]|uniref:Arginine transporter n=1 Tax=Phaeovulum vinaykumarii TaxID=407234 RepID=A0A1N7L167_9RHOB|nr:hypothetical protein [Phaeovulum vinaykumarii]SIS67588.1 hypothetical protein SAMN05421795_102417 [Phaeovulum vinaykumarii]SOC00663.1 hypothetical protein SAMN05878426_102355 [Phaeovulum vinaykumarii]
MKRTLLALLLTGISAPAAFAGPIDGACMRAGRANDPALCKCIQRAADLTLTRADQRRAAGFFKDPHKAQEVRQSDRASDAAFWRRYRNFGDTAEAYCAQ